MYTGNIQILRVLVGVCFVFAAVTLNACRFGEEAKALVVSGDFPLVYIKQPRSTLPNKIDNTTANIGSDLYFRDISSPESEESNLTAILTNGKGAVSGPEVSLDGKKVIFSLLCTEDSSGYCNTDTSWNIWTYDIETGVFQRVINDFETANLADDLDPAFLPNNKIIFTSTRQQAVREKYGYVYTDQYTQKDASVLHTMNLDGTQIEQISFSRNSEFNPTLMQNGKIMFSRRQQLGDKAQMAIFTANPDGSEMNVLYGAHSPGDAFVQARELENGKVISTVIPFEGTWGGGALLEIDSINFSDANSPGPGVFSKGGNGQQAASIQQIPLGKSVSRLGRFTSPYPLLDGSNQVLVSFSFFQEFVDKENETARVNSLNEEEAPPLYGIYMLDMDDKSLKPVVLSEKDMALTNAVAVFPRNNIPQIPRRLNIDVAAYNGDEAEGIINIKSVYDTDQFGRMGQGVLTPSEVGQTPIPLIKPANPQQESREHIADIASLKDPAITRADRRPARFLRVAASIPIPEGFSQYVIGETDYEMQRLIGYAPIEPDGSVRVKVPADTPLILTVLDSKGRAFLKNTNRIQVRSGETLNCNGCHSPQRSLPLNRPPIAGNHPNTELKFMNGLQTGAIALDSETMAETRTRSDPDALKLTKDIIYRDVWTNTNISQLNNSFSYRYAALSSPTPLNGEIHYPLHIQPLWDLPRPSGACINCHDGVTDPVNNPSGLNLKGFEGAGTRMISYNKLLVGGLVLDDNRLPMFETIGGTSVLRRTLPLVNAGYARGSYLVEKLYGEEMFAEKMLPVNGLDHSGFLSEAEKKLLVEWIDMGAQYFNSPFDASGNLRSLESSLTFSEFANLIHPSLISQCGRCHLLNTVGNGVNSDYKASYFILTGNAESDFVVVSDMVNDRQNPAASFLLARPSGQMDEEHWVTGSPGVPLLATDSSLYKRIETWISGQ